MQADDLTVQRRTRARLPLSPLGGIGALLGLALCLYAATNSSDAEAAQEFFLFPRANFIHNSDVQENSGLKRNDFDPAVDLFYTGEFEKWRLLGEILVTEDEHDVERLQIGWLINSNNTIWLGRFHNPEGYWNTQYHHGAFMQTTVDRPVIHTFEDEGGVIPSHLTGLALEGSHSAEHTWNYTFALGAGPTYETDEHKLEPLDVLSPRGDPHKLSGTIRLSYSPELNSANEVGAFASHTLITGNGNPITGVGQTASGVFANWKWDRTRLTSELFFVTDRVDSPTHSNRGSFANAYLQPEFDWRPNWILYARVETTWGDQDDAYLALFPEFVLRRNLAGLRYDFAPHQAVKIEVNRSHRLDDEFNQITVQWSAEFP